MLFGNVTMVFKMRKTMRSREVQKRNYGFSKNDFEDFSFVYSK